MPFEWQEITALPRLEPDELQLFRIHLSDAPEDIHQYKPFLSAVEIDRSERLRAGQVRSQFVVARAALRLLLGNLSDTPPAEVPITLTAFGKPESALATGDRVCFNLAHSRDMILIALSRSGPVGLDLEYLDRDTDALELAQTAFTPTEIQQLQQIADPAARQQVFFNAWTRKEAVVKADGRGLSLSLNSFEIPVLQAAEATSVFVAEDKKRSRPAREWLVTDIFPGEGIAAALAVGLPQPRILGFNFPPKLLASSMPKL